MMPGSRQNGLSSGLSGAVTSYACNGFADLLPLRLCRIPREPRSSAAAVLRFAAARWVQSSDPSPVDRHEAASGGFGQRQEY